MISLCMKPHNVQIQSPASDTSWFSLFHRCVQMVDSDTLARLKAPSPAMICARYDHVTCNIIDLFLDFKEKFPHSNLQNDTHDD
ncbi:MAG TPA: hypothetical protein DCZ97_15615 [Syntrophus sp. (in: bacteria)]|nr:hypothetical protein [Syntrophus sp. (in: bacteria)]